MADHLTAEERAWLLDALAELVEVGGAEPLLEARILEPTPRDFPDPFTPDAAGVRTLVERLARHARIDPGAVGVGAAPALTPEPLVAALCREVSRAWRAVHGAAAEDPAVEERLVDVTAVYLGFGLLTAGDDSGHRHCGHGCRPGGAGSLPPQATSFLLAAQAKARGMGWLARRRLAGSLAANPAAYFAWAHGALPDAGALRTALGAPPGPRA
jgi:hypothetical protein